MLKIQSPCVWVSLKYVDVEGNWSKALNLFVQFTARLSLTIIDDEVRRLDQAILAVFQNGHFLDLLKRLALFIEAHFPKSTYRCAVRDHFILFLLLAVIGVGVQDLALYGTREQIGIRMLHVRI